MLLWNEWKPEQPTLYLFRPLLKKLAGNLLQPCAVELHPFSFSASAMSTHRSRPPHPSTHAITDLTDPAVRLDRVDRKLRLYGRVALTTHAALVAALIWEIVKL